MKLIKLKTNLRVLFTNYSVFIMPVFIFNHQLCEDLFTKIIDNNTDNNMSYSVEVRCN